MGKLQKGRRKNHGKPKGPKPKPKVKHEGAPGPSSGLQQVGSPCRRDASGPAHRLDEEVLIKRHRNEFSSEESADSHSPKKDEPGKMEDGSEAGENGSDIVAEEGAQGGNGSDKDEGGSGQAEEQDDATSDDGDHDDDDDESELEEDEDMGTLDKVFVLGVDNEESVYAPGVDPELVAMGRAQLTQAASLNRRSGSPIFFSDFPDSLMGNNVPMYSRTSVPLAQCEVCGGYAVKSTISKCCHKYCANCTRYAASGQGFHCLFCRKQVMFNVMAPSTEYLSRIKVSCRCGFQGTPVDVNLHAAAEGGRCNDSKVNLVSLMQPLTRKRRLCERINSVTRAPRLRVQDLRPPVNSRICPDYIQMKPDLPYAYLDIDMDGLYIGRIYIELRVDIVPETVERFIELIEDPRGYKGSEVDFVVTNEFFQFLYRASYGRAYRSRFEDENFELKHDKPGVVAMSNFGPNTNQTGFYVTCKETPWRDGRNVVFGHVIAGMQVVNRICGIGRDDGRCIRRVRINDCGMLLNWILPTVFRASDDIDDLL